MKKGRKYNNSNICVNCEELKKKNEELKEENQGLRKELEEFKLNLKTNKYIETKETELNEKNNDLDCSKINSEVSHENTKQSHFPDFIFMPGPSIDGCFLETNGSEFFKETVSLYKLRILNDNPNMANFEFNSDAFGIKNAVSYPDRYLEPICDSINLYNPTAKKIVTVNNGIVEKNGNKWVVLTKAKIKYE